MTDSNYTHIVLVLDDSGSMQGSPAEEMNKALKSYLSEQSKLEGVTLVDTFVFGSYVKYIGNNVEAQYAFTGISGHSGMTALLDGIGTAIDNSGDKFAALPEVKRPGAVQVVIVTDGMENASRLYDSEKVKAKIKEQTDKYGWDFVFLGANIDAVEVGQTFGINPNKAMTFDIYNPHAVGATAQSLSAYTTNYRTAGGAAAAFSDEDRAKAKS